MLEVRCPERIIFFMHSILAPIRLMHREIYLLGWGLVPAVLTRFRVECFLAILALCVLAAVADVVRRSWVGAGFWVTSGGLLITGMRADTMLWGTDRGAALGGAAIAAAAGGVLAGITYQIRQALAEARRERRRYRRIPGTAAAGDLESSRRASHRHARSSRRR